MKAKRSPWRYSAGTSLPSKRRSAGLSSNRSSCDGAPAMNRKMTCLALGAKCVPSPAATRAATSCGVALAGAAKSFSLNTDDSATEPIPKPIWLKKCRRVMRRRASWFTASAFRQGLVEVEQHVADHRPGHRVGVEAGVVAGRVMRPGVLEEPPQPGPLGLRRRAARHEAEAQRQPIVDRRAAFLGHAPAQ